MVDENLKNHEIEEVEIEDIQEEEEESQKSQELDFKVPQTLPVLPLRNTVVFPQQILPISVGREKSIKLIDEAMNSNKLVTLVAQKDGKVDNPKPEDLYRWGTIASIMKVFKMPDGTKSVMVQGVSVAQILEFIQVEPWLKALVQTHAEEKASGVDIDALVGNIRTLFEKVVGLANYLTPDHLMLVANTEDPGRIADIIAWNLNVSTADKQSILEAIDVKTRLEKLTYILTKELQILELGSKIQSEVQGEINKTQREYYLREQLKAIKRELGEEDERTVEINELRKKIQEATMPQEAQEVAEKELDRLTKMPPAAAEYTVSRTYLDWLIDVPWSKRTEDNLDVQQAQKVLDEDHYDLEKVKKRIVEYLAVRKLKNDMKGPILCFVGPPGVGKTSLGRSIARALGRKFIRVSLGGVRDEAEIRGHRRTYIGALPGRIIQSLKKVGSKNPVFMLDEIDKVGMDFRGDPSSALLEVLDPEQNFSFSDHYLEVPFDLSEVIFIATANLADPIIPALKDRMEILELPGYTEEEKLHIAKKYLVPKQLEEHGLEETQVQFEDEAILDIIRSYTREAGVRNLERAIASVCRGVAREVVEGKTKTKVISKDDVSSYLGPIKFFSEIAERTSKPGVATGLAWTPTGGDLLFIEATKMRGKGELILTGSLGDVMKESAKAALSYIRSKSKELKMDDEMFKKYDLHIHVPAGAIPKDGPSAGITILTALISLLSNRLVNSDVAMTGEITLRGLVLPVGGIKEKVLAANRAGIKRVILPEKNKKDIEDIPETVRKKVELCFVSDMDELVKLALSKKEVLE
ncbi:endopeptidase La [candidate division KSB1 bacterium]|nr:endopeptidase La [candidate division KSB1 bacterium]NIR69843.1 endopeptidase La [candidate division KSB1 bacterium]NIS24390.1 endopeptidase La [candidate division KSB1 bacterium]NIT71326.1 endopeptidase La [candidate division KSB1 bacterium]NIU27621.1 endopeptidase La [candidate division KSB1 bacterium]